MFFLIGDLDLKKCKIKFDADVEVWNIQREAKKYRFKTEYTSPELIFQ